MTCKSRTRAATIERRTRPLAAVTALMLAGCSPSGDALYQRAMESLQKGQVGAAQIDLKNLVQSQPENARARAALARANLRAGDVLAAELDVAKAKQLGAPLDLTLGTECLVLSMRGQADKILQDCVADKVQGDARADVLFARGQAMLANGRPDEAVAEFRAAAAARPDNLDALLGLAAVPARSGDVVKARAILGEASPRIRENARYWYVVGQMAGLAGDLAGAEAGFRKAIEAAAKQGLPSERLQALAGLAEAQLQRGAIEDAQRTGDELGKLGLDIGAIKVLRARIATAAGKLDQARTLLEDVLSAEPGNAAARTQLGLVNLREGNLGQAEMNFANVVANDPRNIQAQRLLAEARLRLQSPRATLDAMKPALEQNPDPALLAMAGRLSLAGGDRQQAVAYLSQATARSEAGASPGVQLEIASGFVAAGEYEKAVELLRTLPRSTAGSGYQREYLLIAALMRKGDKDAAIAEARAVLESSGNDPAARNLVAAAYTAAGQPDAGRAQLEQALKDKPNDVATLLSLARLDLAEGKTGDAEARFRKVLEIDDKNLDATTGAALAAGARGDKEGAERWLIKASNDHPQAVGPKVALVQLYLANGSTPKAKALVDAALKASPDNAVLVNLRGLVQMSSRDAPAAIDSFNEARRLAPNEPDFTFNLARARALAGDTPGALAPLDEFLRNSPGHVAALQLAVMISLQGGQAEKAAGYVERLRQAAPSSPVTERLEGDVALAQKRYKDAVQSYRKAGEKERDTGLVLAEYKAASLAGDPAALKRVEEWVALHPEDGAAVVIVAEARREAGKRDAAIDLYEKGLARSPNSAVMLNNLAVLYQDKGDARAVDTARRAYELMPKSAAMMDTYGWALFGDGKVAEALPILEGAAKALPGVGEIQYHYAAALAGAGRKDDALEALRKALAGDLPPAVRTDAQKLLKQLSK